MTFGLINATRWAGRSSLRTLCMACALGVRKYARSREENKTVEKQQNMCVDLGCKFIVCVSHADKALRNRDGNQEPGSAYCCLDTILLHILLFWRFVGTLVKPVPMDTQAGGSILSVHFYQTNMYI